MAVGSRSGARLTGFARRPAHLGVRRAGLLSRRHDDGARHGEREQRRLDHSRAASGLNPRGGQSHRATHTPDMTREQRDAFLRPVD